MGRKEDKDTYEINNISDELQKNHKIVNNLSWRLVNVVITFAFVVVFLMVAYDSYIIKVSQLKVEANNINNEINDKFSLIVNSISLNGYTTVLEQYLKTSGQEDIKESIYYDNTVQTLNNMSTISDEIENTFVVSFANNSVLYSGVNNVYQENYDYKNKPWYNYNKIISNSVYLSEKFTIDELGTGELCGIVRPIMDSMNDEPLGAIIYGFDTSYIEQVLDGATVKNNAESVVRIDEGNVIYSTHSFEAELENEAFVENYVNTRWNITYNIHNSTLNWNIITYCSIWAIIANGIIQFIIVIVLFALLYITFNKFIKKLKSIKVIRTGREVKEVIDLSEIQEDDIVEDTVEEVDIDEFEEMPIDDVLEIEEIIDRNN